MGRAIMGFLTFTDPALLRAINHLTKKVDHIMTTVSELEIALNAANTTLTAVQAGVENIAGDVLALDAEIQALKDSLANTQIPASTQAAMDNLTSISVALMTRTADIAAQTPDQVNPV